MGKDRGRRSRLRFRTLVRWLWYFETCPVTADEVILRRIPNVMNYYNPSLPESPILFESFRPNDQRDTDGISLNRLDFVTRKQLARRSQNKNGTYIASFKVADLNNLGLTVESSPTPNDLPGHVIIPELRFSNYESNKKKYKPLLYELAKLAMKYPIFGPTMPRAN